MALASIAQSAREISKKLGLTSDLLLLDHAWNIEAGNLREFSRITALDHSSLVIEEIGRAHV